jgi:hypothetical protein
MCFGGSPSIRIPPPPQQPQLPEPPPPPAAPTRADRLVDKPDDDDIPRLATPGEARAIRETGTTKVKRRTGKSQLRIEPQAISSSSGLQIR